MRNVGGARLLRPVRNPDRRTSWPLGKTAAKARLLEEGAGLPDYPPQILLEDNNRILLEQ